jgi:hypothetical protein
MYVLSQISVTLVLSFKLMLNFVSFSVFLLKKQHSRTAYFLVKHGVGVYYNATFSNALKIINLLCAYIVYQLQIEMGDG